MSGSSGRVVTLIDMDCFYCQVEARLNPIHKGKPLAVVQYNQWKGGGIIAVNYEARDKGVKRGMRGAEAKQKCPDIVLVSVASVRGKADLSKYRDAGKEVVDVFKDFCDCVERASIDEAYLDLTQAVEVRTQTLLDSGVFISVDQLLSTFVVGFCPDKSNAEDTRISGLREFLEDQKFNRETLRLAVAAVLVEELRTEVLKRTGFHCSAGIAHNKILAKLVCGIHKPRRQTVLPASCVEQLFSALPVCKVRNLGGKFGSKVVEDLGCETMGDLARFSKEDLQQRFDEKTGCWLYDIARGIDNDPVTPRLIPKSIGCSKNFPGRNSLRTKDDVEHWMKELCDEVAERLSQDLQENKRRAQLLTVTVSLDGQSTSRSNALTSYDGAKIAADALSLISRCNTAPANSTAWQPAIKMIAVSASKFVSDEGFRCSGIQSFFKLTPKSVKDDTDNEDIESNRKDSMSSKLLTKPTLKPPPNPALQTDKFFKPSQTDDIKSAEKPGIRDERSESAVDVASNVIAKGSAENSFFLSYLQNLKSNSATTSTNITTQSNSNNGSSDEAGLRNSLNSSRGSSLNASDRSDTPSKREETDEVLILIKEMFPNPVDVEGSVISLLSSSMQEKFYSWRSLFRRENGLLSPVKLLPSRSKLVTPEKVLVNPRRNGLQKIPTMLNSPRKQVETEKVPQLKPKGGIESFFQNCSKAKDVVNSEPKPGSSKSLEEPTTSVSSEQTAVFPFSENSDSCDVWVKDEISWDEMELCSICHRMILLREFPEHVDYHAAVSLDERLNKGDQAAAVVETSVEKAVVKTPAVKMVAKSSVGSAGIPIRKRGRPPKAESLQNQNQKKLKSISSFFPVKEST